MQSDIFLNSDIWIKICDIIGLQNMIKMGQVSKKFVTLTQSNKWNFTYGASKKINKIVYNYNIRKVQLNECDVDILTIKYINNMNVEHLELRNCEIFVEDVSPIIHSVTNLTIDAKHTVTKIIQFFDKLESLNIYRLHISDEYFSNINFQNIKSLDIVQCPYITDVGLETISNIMVRKLERLKIFGCDRITVYGVLNVIKYDTIKYLDLSYLSALQICKHLTTYKFLEHLHLCGQISDSDLQYISKFRSRLKYLEINSNQITDYGIKSLKNMDIGQLTLYARNVTDKSLKYIGHIPYLYFERARVLGVGLKYLSKCYEFLVGNSIISSIDCLKYFDNVQIVSLESCTITDENLKYLNTPTIRKELCLYCCDNITNLGLVFVGKWQSIDIDECKQIKAFTYTGTYQQVAEEIMRQYVVTYMSL
jgi:hypothetical protein